MAEITIVDRPVFYKQSGPHPAETTRPTLVLLHGAGGSHLDWPTTVRFIDELPVIVPDLPGHGRSAGPGRQTIEEYANFVADFVAALNLSRVVVGGHSMGGAIAQLVALQNPLWLKGLIIIGSGPMMRVAPQILDHIHDDMPSVADFFTKYAWSRSANFMMKGVGRKRILENDPDVLFGDFSACNQFEVQTDLAQITIPTLVIGGQEDRFMPLKFSQKLADGIPHARLVIINGAGHMMHLEKPEEVQREVERFVKAI